MPNTDLLFVLRSVLYALVASTGLYAVFLSILMPTYLSSGGFLRNQVTPFSLRTEDGETLRASHAWHILPLQLYSQHEKELLEEPSRLAPFITYRLGFKLLQDDPSSLLVLYFHGAADTLGSGWRPPSYRAMSAGAP
ncbi:hypothetical protein GGR53DRAFT_470992 [Hypoxylon sp. FL1150]|nr:hypothetical protein GGR53DRAFT_470992 [Hypoxylon sp. FL1150]